MSYLVDANVLSEANRPEPNRQVIHWLRDNEQRLFVDSIVVAELLFGIRLLPPSRKRAKLEIWFETTVEKIQCLSWDAAVGKRWAILFADLKRKGASIPLFDSMVAATALTHDLTVATHNTRDFRIAGVKLVDPFDS